MSTATLREYVNRWGLRAVAIALLLTIVLFLASLVVGYVGDEYVSPAWSEQSVPAPRLN
jgi:hypothetical protein